MNIYILECVGAVEMLQEPVLRYYGRCITVALIVRDLFTIFQSKCMSSLGAYVTLMKDVVQPSDRKNGCKEVTR